MAFTSLKLSHRSVLKVFGDVCWVSEERDPSAEAVFAINKALQTFNPQAASEFVRLYLGNGGEDG